MLSCIYFISFQGRSYTEDSMCVVLHCSCHAGISTVSILSRCCCCSCGHQPPLGGEQQQGDHYCSSLPLLWLLLLHNSTLLPLLLIRTEAERIKDDVRRCFGLGVIILWEEDEDNDGVRGDDALLVRGGPATCRLRDGVLGTSPCDDDEDVRDVASSTAADVVVDVLFLLEMRPRLEDFGTLGVSAGDTTTRGRGGPSDVVLLLVVLVLFRLEWRRDLEVDFVSLEVSACDGDGAAIVERPPIRNGVVMRGDSFQSGTCSTIDGVIVWWKSLLSELLSLLLLISILTPATGVTGASTSSAAVLPTPRRRWRDDLGVDGVASSAHCCSSALRTNTRCDADRSPIPGRRGGDDVLLSVALLLLLLVVVVVAPVLLRRDMRCSDDLGDDPVLLLLLLTLGIGLLFSVHGKTIASMASWASHSAIFKANLRLPVLAGREALRRTSSLSMPQ
jgi:hypothetical protein